MCVSSVAIGPLPNSVVAYSWLIHCEWQSNCDVQLPFAVCYLVLLLLVFFWIVVNGGKFNFKNTLSICATTSRNCRHGESKFELLLMFVRLREGEEWGVAAGKTMSKALSLLPLDVTEKKGFDSCCCCCCCCTSLVTLFENMAHAVLEFDLLWAGSGCPRVSRVGTEGWPARWPCLRPIACA